MNQRESNLSNTDHSSMDEFLAKMLDAYKNGEISRNNAVSKLKLGFILPPSETECFYNAQGWNSTLRFLS